MKKPCGTWHKTKNGEDAPCITENGQPCSLHPAGTHETDANGNTIIAYSQAEFLEKKNAGVQTGMGGNAATVTDSKAEHEKHVHESTLEASKHSTISGNNRGSMDWMNESKKDIPAWAGLIQKDKDGNPVDYEWMQSLDYEKGVGVLTGRTPDEISRMSHDESIKALDDDIAIRTKLEAFYLKTNQAFMNDDGSNLQSYDFARTVGLSTVALNDEIDLIRRNLTEDERKAYDDADKKLDYERRNSWKKYYKKQDSSSPSSDSISKKTYARPPKKDSECHYLPGQDTNEVIGIDIETDGLKEYRSHIIDIGMERMNVNPDADNNGIDASRMVTDENRVYTESGYDNGGAYDAQRQMYGVPPRRETAGNPAAFVSGIDTDVLKGKVSYDENPEAQAAVLQKLKSAPYIAHNARFEHGYMLLHTKGYAEAYRNGDISYIDTMYMSIKWDQTEENANSKPHGYNSLDSYSKRQGIIDKNDHERHLGLEDTHIMLLAMKKHLQTLKNENRGPWNPDDPIIGVGGKKVHTKQ